MKRLKSQMESKNNYDFGTFLARQMDSSGGQHDDDDRFCFLQTNSPDICCFIEFETTTTTTSRTTTNSRTTTLFGPPRHQRRAKLILWNLKSSICVLDKLEARSGLQQVSYCWPACLSSSSA